MHQVLIFAAAVSKARINATKQAGNYSLTPNNLKFLSPEEGIHRLNNSKILAVRNQNAETGKPMMGIPVDYIPFSEVNNAWSSANKDDAASIVERWKKISPGNNWCSSRNVTDLGMYVPWNEISY